MGTGEDLEGRESRVSLIGLVRGASAEGWGGSGTNRSNPCNTTEATRPRCLIC